MASTPSTASSPARSFDDVVVVVATRTTLTGLDPSHPQPRHQRPERRSRLPRAHHPRRQCPDRGRGALRARLPGQSRPGPDLPAVRPALHQSERGFRQLTGYRREDVLGRSIYEVDVLERAERREFALERLRAGETITQMEASLTVPSDPGGRLVVVAGQPIEIGDAPCMLFTFADLEPRRKAETALRHSEERFAKAFRLVPVPTAIVTRRRARLSRSTTPSAHSGLRSAGRGRPSGRRPAPLGRRWRNGSAFARRSPGRYRAGLRGAACARRTVRHHLPDRRRDRDHRRPVLHPVVFQDITSRKRSEEDLVEAIEAVMADASWFSRGVVEKLAALRQPPRPGQPPVKRRQLADLTAREREILGLVCQGRAMPRSQRARARAQHRTQPRRLAVPQARRQPAQRPDRLGTRARHRRRWRAAEATRRAEKGSSEPV